jgi:hypothetical protein
MKRWLLSFLLLAATALAQTDIKIGQVGPNYTLARNVAWASAGKYGFNNNYIFTPSSPNSSLCIFVQNLDSGSSHTFFLATAITGDSSVTGYANFTNLWFKTGIPGSIYQVAALGSARNTIGLFAKLSGASQVAVLTSAGSGTGNATITVVETSSGGCSTNPYGGTVAYNPLSNSSYATNTGFTATKCVTNPGAGANLLTLVPFGFNPIINFWKVRLGSTAAGEIDIDLSTSSGSTCSTVTPVNTELFSSNTSQTNVTTSCSTTPSVGGIYDKELVGASTPVEIELTGFVASTSNGLDIVTPSAITGTVCATMYWGEQ